MVKTESDTLRTGLSEVCPIGGSAVEGVPRGRGLEMDTTSCGGG